MFKQFCVWCILALTFLIARTSDVLGSEVNTFYQQIKKRGGRHAEAIMKAVKYESEQQRIDPAILLAVIEQESGFRSKMHGRHGEIGLMQIKPSTAKWIAREKTLPWKGARSLEDPSINIKLGAAYLSQLREEFGGDVRFYLAAYNMGSANLRKVLKRFDRHFDSNRNANGRHFKSTYAQSVLRRYGHARYALRSPELFSQI